MTHCFYFQILLLIIAIDTLSHLIHEKYHSFPIECIYEYEFSSDTNGNSPTMSNHIVFVNN